MIERGKMRGGGLDLGLVNSRIPNCERRTPNSPRHGLVLGPDFHRMGTWPYRGGEPVHYARDEKLFAKHGDLMGLFGIFVGASQRHIHRQISLFIAGTGLGDAGLINGKSL